MNNKRHLHNVLYFAWPIKVDLTVLQGWLVDGYSSESLMFSKLFKKVYFIIVFLCTFIENYLST